MKQTVAAVLSSMKMQIDNCLRSNNQEWLVKTRAKQTRLIRDFLPSGSGIDNGTVVESISDDRIVLSCSFHHMDDQGSYDGWTEHKITARCGFYLGITITVSGRDKNDIKEFLEETYQLALSTPIEWSEEKDRYVEVSRDA